MGTECQEHWSRLRPVVKETQSQICCVIRHAERADSAYALLNGLPWTRTDDARRWPLDPPLSDAGEVGAQEAAEIVQSFSEKMGSTIDVVVTSPYLRCVQTAAMICNRLGPDTKLMLDASLGEIFGPSLLGDSEPQHHRRPLQTILEECESRGVKHTVPRLMGTEPSWPETLHDGRHRFAETFLHYVERSRYGCRNFAVVTHGDCVAAATTLFPMPARVVGVDPGGMLLASRRMKKSSMLWLSNATSRAKFRKDNSAGQVPDAPPSPRSGASQEAGGAADNQDLRSSQPLGPAAGYRFMGGWSADSFGIQFEPEKSRGIRKSVETAMKNMARLSATSKLPQDHLHKLLRTLSDESFGVEADRSQEECTAEFTDEPAPRATSKESVFRRRLATRAFVLNLSSFSSYRSSADRSSGASTLEESERMTSTLTGGSVSTAVSVDEIELDAMIPDDGEADIPVVKSSSKTPMLRPPHISNDQEPKPPDASMSFASSPLWKRRMAL